MRDYGSGLNGEWHKTRGRIVKPVIQLQPTGCAIASVAAIAGFSYPKVKSIANSIGIFAEDKKLWSETTHVRNLLKRFGIETGSEKKPFRSWEALPYLALLSIKWHLEKDRPFWHWVVFVRENGRSYALDSKRNLSTHYRTDFGRMKPKWYIPILKK
jgi:hypothetical protein